jgi:hypothetical protein
MVNMMDQDTKTGRKQVFDTQPTRRNGLLPHFQKVFKGHRLRTVIDDWQLRNPEIVCNEALI